MTTLQKKMIIKIAENEMAPGNGSKPKTFEETGDVWTDCVVEDAEDKGVATSLVNAGMVEMTCYKNKRDNTICLTKAGFFEYLKV